VLLPAPDAAVSLDGREPELVDVLRTVLGEHFGSPQTILDVQRLRSEHSSSYETELVTVTLEGTGEITLFLKDFGARIYDKDSISQRRSRELRVYRDLLGSVNLGTPAYYGSIWDERRGRFWLLIEFVEGAQVKHREFPDWVEAMVWLGRMHAHFSKSPPLIEAREFLTDQDADFFRFTADMARRAVAASLPGLSDRLEAALAGYDEAVGLIDSQPRVLVHGGYRPQNVILAGTPQEPRICPVDWEEAALGSSLYDAAYFCDGFDGDRLAVLLDAYRAEAARHGFPPPEGPEADRVFALLSLHKSLGTLKAAERSFPDTSILKLVGMVESAAERAQRAA
jgi:aminoglycoside phosphotransferase (APT) family kinase protein